MDPKLEFHLVEIQAVAEEMTLMNIVMTPAEENWKEEKKKKKVKLILKDNKESLPKLTLVNKLIVPLT
jgi:hypothetical protein